VSKNVLEVPCEGQQTSWELGKRIS